MITCFFFSLKMIHIYKRFKTPYTPSLGFIQENKFPATPFYHPPTIPCMRIMILILFYEIIIDILQTPNSYETFRP